MLLPSRQPFFQVLISGLRPLVRFALRRGVQFQDVQEILRILYLEVAGEEMVERGEKINVSRLSAATGLQRRDVMRLRETSLAPDEPQGLISRLIGQWSLQKRFLNAKSKPRPLTFEGEGSEFSRLVRSLTNDIHPGTVLFELERLGAITREGGKVKLDVSAYVPRGDQCAQYQIVARDTEDLMTAADENINERHDTANLHARTEFDNILVEKIPQIRKHLLERGAAFHREMREYLGRYDRDINERLRGKEGRARVAVGTFSICEEKGRIKP